MDTLLHNLGYGLRMLRKQPMVSAISVLALALGIGLTTTMFSILHAALRDLPFDEPQEIVMLERTAPSRGVQSWDVTQHEFVDWREQQTGFEGLGAFYQGTINVTGGERPVRFNGAFITASTFSLLGVQPALGRGFGAADELPGADPALLLGHDVWRTRFNADPSAVGSAVRINGLPGTIIGVMPEGFAFPMAEEAWLPLRIDLSALERGDGNWVTVVGRLKDGVSMEAALSDMNLIAERIESEYPVLNEGVRVAIKPFVREYIDDDVLAMLWTMQGAVLMVLLIACANVANLLLARAIDRHKEIAVRTALGAGRLRIVGQFLSEVLVLATLGGAAGLGIARVGTALFNRALVDVEKPYWIVVNIDLQVLLFTTVLVVVASLLAGLVPALQVTGSNLHDVLKDEARGSSSLRLGRLSRALVVAEVALSCGLLVGAGLMIKSVAQLRTLDFGFPAESVFTARVGLFPTDYPEPEARRQFFEQLADRLGTIPGASGATLADALPGTQRASMSRIELEGSSYSTEQDKPLANFAVVAPHFFETFDARLLQGRDFTALDTADSMPVAIVNQSMVERVFAGGEALGRRLRIDQGSSQSPDDGWLTVVGVVPDLYMEGVSSIGQREPQGMYLPLSQQDRQFMSIAVRAPGDPMAVVGPVRAEIAALDADLPIYWVQTLMTTIDADTWFYRVFGNLFMAFGVAALFLATIGLYGVMSFSVRRRTPELGIRMALGAQTGGVVGLLMRQGLWQIAIGLALGLGLAMLMAGGLQLVLFQVNPRDPTIFAAITLALAVTGALACLLPARRAARIHPVTALRNE